MAITVLAWLQANSYAVVAVGSVITALATAVLAFYANSSRRLLELERTRDRSERTVIAARLTRMLVHLASLQMILEIGEEAEGHLEDRWSDGELARRQLSTLAHQLGPFINEAKSAFDAASRSAPSSVPLLHYTLIALESALFAASAGNLADVRHNDPVKARETVIRHFKHAGGAFLAAYEAIEPPFDLFAKVAGFAQPYREFADSAREAVAGEPAPSWIAEMRLYLAHAFRRR